MKTVGAWLVIVFVLSVYPFEPYRAAFRHADKALHFILYAITSALFITVFIKKKSYVKAVVLSIILASLYGFLMEAAQSFIPTHREFSIYDQLANTLGAICGAVAVTLLRKRKGL